MSGRILALEEDLVRTAELRIALESPGHCLISFEGFYQALDYAKEQEIDLALCDIHLQNASAFEFLHEMRRDSKTRGVAVVFYCIEPSNLTKPFVEGIAVAALKLGARDVIFMDKFEAAELCRSVEKLLPAYVERRCA